MPEGPICIDCIAEGVKARRDVAVGATKSRCLTHWRIVKRNRKAAAHDSRVGKVYGLAPGQYAELYATQGGRCAICQWATGATKRLAVDHDHGCCAGPTSCGQCVRGLLCGPCNVMIGRLGAAALRRAADYLDARR